MDLSGLLFGGRSKLTENQNPTQNGILGQNLTDPPDDVKVGFWQFLQHFLHTNNSPAIDESLEIANIGLAEIDINPSAVDVEEMIGMEPQTASSNVDKQSNPIMGMENRAQFRDAFSKMSAKRWLTHNELADIVSLAKNTAPEGVFSEENLQQIAQTLQAILDESETATTPAELQPEISQLDEKIKNPEVDKVSTGPDSEVIPDILPENVSVSTLEGESRGALTDSLPTGADREIATQPAVVVPEHHNILRPIVLASYLKEDGAQRWQLQPAFSLQNSAEQFVVAIDNGQVMDDFELAGMPAPAERAQNFVQVIAPEQTDAAQITIEIPDAAVVADAVNLDDSTSPEEFNATNELIEQFVEAATETANENNVQQQPDQVEGKSDALPVSPEVMPIEKNEWAPRHSQQPVQKQTSNIHTAPPEIHSENGLPLDINENDVFASLEKFKSRGQLDQNMTTKLQMRILKISHAEAEQTEGQVVKRAQEIILPENHKSQLIKNETGLQKTAAAWQLALSDKLQNQTQPIDLHNGANTGGEDNPGLRQNAMKSYTQHSPEKKQGENAQNVAPNVPENNFRSNGEPATVIDEKQGPATPHAAKIFATKSKVVHQLDRVKSFENIRSQIATKVRPGQSEIQIQLKPESLGSMRLMMSMKNGLLNVNFFVESTDVKSLLDKNIPALRETLADRGIKAEHVEVQVNQPVAQTNRSENQETRYSRNQSDDSQRKQDDRPRHQKQNRQENQNKKFDQYL